jgi:Ulp1 family protease
VSFLASKTRNFCLISADIQQRGSRGKLLATYKRQNEAAQVEQMAARYQPSVALEQQIEPDNSDVQRAAELRRAHTKRPRLSDVLSTDTSPDDISSTLQRQTRASASDQPRASSPIRTFRSEILQTRSSPRHVTRRTSYRDADPNMEVDDVLDVPDHMKYSNNPGLGKEWDQSVIFPETGMKRVTVDFRDLLRLDEGEFLNDNLIAFYLRYCEQQYAATETNDKPKVHFFNNYFYTSLMTNEKGKKGFNYKAVQRWTSKVDIFDFDYIVVPINEDLHWYVAIICNLPNLRKRLVLDGTNDEKPAESDTLRGHVLDALEEHTNAALATNAAALRTANVSAQESSHDGEEHRPSSSGLSPQGKSTSHDGLRVDDDAAAMQLQEESTRADPSKRTDVLPFQDLPSSQTELAKHHDGHDRMSPNRLKKPKRHSAPPTRTYDGQAPAIIVMDSLEQSRGPTIRALKDYLREEGKQRRGMELTTSDLQGVNARYLPVQDNYCDCGLFLLGYVVKFLENPRVFTNSILNREVIEFPALNPSMMRHAIRTLLQDLHKQQKLSRDTKRLEKRKSLQAQRPDRKVGAADKSMPSSIVDLNTQTASKKPVPPPMEEKEAEVQQPARLITREQPKAYKGDLSTKDGANSSRLELHKSGGVQGRRTISPRKEPQLSLLSQPLLTSQETPTKQPESQDDSVVFVSEQPVTKQISQTQSLPLNMQPAAGSEQRDAPPTVPSDAKCIPASSETTQDEEMRTGSHESRADVAGSDIMAQLQQAAGQCAATDAMRDPPTRQSPGSFIPESP